MTDTEIKRDLEAYRQINESLKQLRWHHKYAPNDRQGILSERRQIRYNLREMGMALPDRRDATQ